MKSAKMRWLNALGEPSDPIPEGRMTLVSRFFHPEFDGELYYQVNGPATAQRVMMVFPKEIHSPCPAVVIPFYFPEAMLGINPYRKDDLSRYVDVDMMYHLVKRGYITISADAFHLTYYKSDRNRGDFTRWQEAAEHLLADHPNWTGMGKLVSDTKLLIDALEADERVDASRIGIAGHSLGGKMAMYTGCLDNRVKAILSSDPGILWDRTNWRDIWYWGDKVDSLITQGMDHADLLGAGQTPFCLLAGDFDNEESGQMMLRAPGFLPEDARLKIINHATGHRPPPAVLQEGYDFLDTYLK